ncbi:DUF6624 domain-containing protein [Psychroserpens sp. MEBiC05023]
MLNIENIRLGESFVKYRLYFYLFMVTVSCKVDKKDTIDYIDYYSSVYEADSLFIEKKYSESYSILKEIFDKYEPINMDIYYEYETYLSSAVELEKTSELCDDLITLVSKYGYNKQRIFDNPNLKKIADSCPEVSKKIDELYQVFVSSLNLSLRNEMHLMVIEDQKYRGNGTYQDNVVNQEKIDEENTNRLIEIFNEYGYPNQELIGDYFVDQKHLMFTSILLHTNDSVRENYFIPKLLEFLKKGKCNPITYASMVDQLYLYNGESQIYGTYSNNMNISNFEKLDTTRKSIGLPAYGYEEWRIKKLYGHIDFEKLKEESKTK